MRKEPAVQLESAIQREADKHFLNDIGADNTVYQCMKVIWRVFAILAVQLKNDADSDI